MIAIDEEVKSIANRYRELKLKVAEDLKKLDDYSLTLFKSFLQYVKDNEEKFS